MAGEVARYWQHAGVPGVDLLRARYVTHRYSRHAHETFTFALIEAGIEEFNYGGSLLRAGPGGVALLNPDMVHTGHAGTPDGWAYRVLYPDPALVGAVAAEMGWRLGTPSFPETVVYDGRSAPRRRTPTPAGPQAGCPRRARAARPAATRSCGLSPAAGWRPGRRSPRSSSACPSCPARPVRARRCGTKMP